MVGPKKQDFWPKISILITEKKIRMTVCQKLGMILESKVIQN